MEILLVEDEKGICEAISIYAKVYDYNIDFVNCGLDAIDKIKENNYDLLILDVGLPDINGFDLIKIIHNEIRYIPTIFLTARIYEGDRVFGLKLGADDYLIKPFNMEELFLRIKGILKRVNSHLVVKNDFTFNTKEYQVDYNGRKLNLPHNAFKLLLLLVRNEGKTLTRKQILKEVWGIENEIETRTIDMHIKMIRDELMNNTIKTVRGKGYRYESE